MKLSTLEFMSHYSQAKVDSYMKHWLGQHILLTDRVMGPLKASTQGKPTTNNPTIQKTHTF